MSQDQYESEVQVYTDERGNVTGLSGRTTKRDLRAQFDALREVFE